MHHTTRKDTDIGQIPHEWEVLKVEEFSEVIGGGTPSTTNAENFGGNISWITPRDLSNFTGKYIGAGERNITDKGLQGSGAKLLPKGTVLLTSRAPIGYVAIANNEVTTNQGFKSMICNEKAHNEFVYYLIKHNKNFLEGHGSGSTFKEISGSVLKGLKFALPPLPEQKAIASILGSLDDKIELLRQQNKILEAIGQTIFKEWFIDFNFPGSQGFMTESDLGLMPKGWVIGKLGDIADITSGKRPNNKSEKQEGEYRIPLLGAGGIMGYTSDVLFDEHMIILGRVGTHGQINRVNYPCRPSDNTLIVQSKYFEYVYQILCNINYESLNKGAVQPLITQTDMKNYSIIMPSDEILAGFEKNNGALFEKIYANKSSIESLSGIRDNLLSRLMSGKIRAI